MPNTKSQDGELRQNRQLIRKSVEFDYGNLAVSLRTQVQKETEVIRTLLHRTAESVIQIGLRINGVHDILGRDLFQGWLSSQFGWSQSTASNYMQAARKFCEVKCLEQFQPSALFELARRKASDNARAEALRRALSGEIITKRIAQQIIRTHSTRPPTKQGSHLLRVCRTLKGIHPRINTLSAAEADEVHRILVALLSDVNALRANSSSAESSTDLQSHSDSTPPERDPDRGRKSHRYKRDQRKSSSKR